MRLDTETPIRFLLLAHSMLTRGATTFGNAPLRYPALTHQNSTLTTQPTYGLLFPKNLLSCNQYGKTASFAHLFILRLSVGNTAGKRA